jgi:hypothetical protein
MKGICDNLVKSVKSGGNEPPELNTVALNFIQLQQHRHTADYDNSRRWSRLEALKVVALSSAAFVAWRSTISHDAAQDFLLQLFLPKLPRE